MGYYFNPRSPRGERPDVPAPGSQASSISIHAPRGGSDRRRAVLNALFYRYFNPRSPRGERLDGAGISVTQHLFQSTLPAGGATEKVRNYRDNLLFQSTLPAGGATMSKMSSLRDLAIFQSTLPAGGATLDETAAGNLQNISIHAPRGGSDRVDYVLRTSDVMISIHAPRGGSDMQNCSTPSRPGRSFQSTLPAGGATGP